jgi:hypothetical protein
VFELRRAKAELNDRAQHPTPAAVAELRQAGLSVREVVQLLGVTLTRVSQIEKQASLTNSAQHPLVSQPPADTILPVMMRDGRLSGVGDPARMAPSRSGGVTETEQQAWLVLAEVECFRDQAIIEATDDDTTQPSGRTAQRKVLHRRADLDVHVAEPPGRRWLVTEVADHVADIRAECDRDRGREDPRLIPDRCSGQLGANILCPSRDQAPGLR